MKIDGMNMKGMIIMRVYSTRKLMKRLLIVMIVKRFVFAFKKKEKNNCKILENNG